MPTDETLNADYDKMQAEREERDKKLYPDSDPMEYINSLLKDQELAKKTAKARDNYVTLNNDPLSEVNASPEDMQEINEINKESNNTGLINVDTPDVDTPKVVGEQPSPDDISAPKPTNRIADLLSKIKAERETGRVGVEKALADKKDASTLAMLSEGAAQIGAGIGSMGGIAIKPDVSVAKHVRDMAKSGVESAQTRAKLGQQESKDLVGDELTKSKLEQLDPASEFSQKLQKITKAQGMDTGGMNAADILQTYKLMKVAKKEKELSTDPKSAESEQMRTALKGAGFEGDLSNWNAQMMNKALTALVRKTTTNIQRERETRLENKFGFTKKEKFEKDTREALKDMRATDTWKTAEKSLATIPEISNLLEDAYKKGGQSLAMLGPKIAKGIAGEVGVLTEADVTRYVQNPTLVGGLIDTLKKISSGEISKVSYNNLKRLLEIAKKTAKYKMDSAIDRESTLLARREGIDYSDARHFMDNEYMKKDMTKQEIASSTDDVAPKSNEVERKTKDGRVAIFDAKSKEFLRYK